ncbi:hypothetical protein GGS24DRAFT_511190 [Hypoxylon argillaceum]|nr:hypothetical protein GGS24DRAFT_511190 [Hypoxylon argillaceum]
MDPVTAIGVVGSAVGIAGFGIQLSQLLFNYISLVRSAQEHLNDIASQIHLTAFALDEVFEFIQQAVVINPHGRPLSPFSPKSLSRLNETGVQCLVIFWRVEAAVLGNPALLEEQLPEKLVQFKNTFEQNSHDFSIQIKLKGTLDDLTLKQKLR